MAPFIDRGKSPSPTYVNTTAIVEACDIPILSSTDRLQRTLLRWIDVCGMSGQLSLDMDVVDALTGHQFLDEQTYLVEIEGTDPSRWDVIWAGADTAFDSQVDFREAFISTIPEERYVDLVAQDLATISGQQIDVSYEFLPWRRGFRTVSSEQENVLFDDFGD